MEVTCQDEGVWRERLERRGRELAGTAHAHKPATWQQLLDLLEGYQVSVRILRICVCACVCGVCVCVREREEREKREILRFARCPTRTAVFPQGCYNWSGGADRSTIPLYLHADTSLARTTAESDDLARGVAEKLRETAAASTSAVAAASSASAPKAE